MEITIRTRKNEESGKAKLPVQFSEVVRDDLIKRAVLAEQSVSRQRYGNRPDAGMRVSAKLSRRRRKYRGGYGVGMSRVPRKILSRSGTRFNWVAAEAPGTRGGRRAHGPTAEKVFAQKINNKELAKALRSALSATVQKDVVLSRGHKVPDTYPFILSDDMESISKTKDFQSTLETLGFSDEMSRAAIKKVRAGVGKMRNRRYKRRVGPVVVVSSDCALQFAAKNIPGFDVVTVSNLTAHTLAPGCHAGRAALFTVQALKEMEDKQLFM